VLGLRPYFGTRGFFALAVASLAFLRCPRTDEPFELRFIIRAPFALIRELRDPFDRALLRDPNDPSLGSLFALLDGRERCPRTFGMVGSLIDFFGLRFLGTVDVAPLPRADDLVEDTFDDFAEPRALRPVTPLLTPEARALLFALSFVSLLLRSLSGSESHFVHLFRGAKLTRVSSAFLNLRFGSSLAF